MKNIAFEHQKTPFIVPTDDAKYIAEHVGLATTGNPNLSIAHMKAPPHWSEPFQTPEFDEYTLIISGKLHVSIDNQDLEIEAGESIHVKKGQKVRYSNPFNEWCEYVAVCTPAFHMNTVHREEN